LIFSAIAGERANRSINEEPFTDRSLIYRQRGEQRLGIEVIVNEPTGLPNNKILHIFKKRLIGGIGFCTVHINYLFSISVSGTNAFYIEAAALKSYALQNECCDFIRLFRRHFLKDTRDFGILALNTIKFAFCQNENFTVSQGSD
jgi:hypothetical protein